MQASASRIQPEQAEQLVEIDAGRQDSQVYLKAPCVESNPAEREEADAPADFVAFLGEKQGLDEQAAFTLLCSLLSEYRTPVRREIALLKRSA